MGRKGRPRHVGRRQTARPVGLRRVRRHERGSLPRLVLHARPAAAFPQPVPPQHRHSLRRRMSHHFDYPADETLDISDAYCFAGPGDLRGPRTVFGMNTSPFGAPTWNAAGYYELKIDTNGDYVEDITFRATFPVGPDGTQHVRVEQLTGAAATDRTASGTIITPPNTRIGNVVECSNGI